MTLFVQQRGFADAGGQASRGAGGGGRAASRTGCKAKAKAAPRRQVARRRVTSQGAASRVTPSGVGVGVASSAAARKLGRRRSSISTSSGSSSGSCRRHLCWAVAGALRRSCIEGFAFIGVGAVQKPRASAPPLRAIRDERTRPVRVGSEAGILKRRRVADQLEKKTFPTFLELEVLFFSRVPQSVIAAACRVARGPQAEDAAARAPDAAAAARAAAPGGGGRSAWPGGCCGPARPHSDVLGELA